MPLKKTDLLNKPACHPKLVLGSHKAVTHGASPTALCPSPTQRALDMELHPRFRLNLCVGHLFLTHLSQFQPST